MCLNHGLYKLAILNLLMTLNAFGTILLSINLDNLWGVFIINIIFALYSGTYINYMHSKFVNLKNINL